MAFCTKCGSQLVDGSKFCVKCGAPVAAPVVEDTPVIPEAPVVEDTPVIPEAPVVEDTPVIPEAPVVEDTPVIPEAPVVEDTPVIPEAPVVEDTPVIPEAPAVEDTPVIPEAPAVEDTPVIPVTPVIEAPLSVPVEKEPKKKKKKGLLIGVISAISVLVIGIIVLIVLLFTGTDEVDLSKCLAIKYEGFEEVGKAQIDIEATKQNIAKEILKAQGEEVSSKNLTTEIKQLINSIVIEVDSDNVVNDITSEGKPVLVVKKLDNGDKINVKITYDEKLMEECSLEFSADTVEKTVSGLQGLTEVNPFDFITVEFYGTSPNGYLNVDNNNYEDYRYCYSVKYDNSSDLKNGDKVTLTIEVEDEEGLASYGYKITETSKEYTVEGLEYYVASAKDIQGDIKEQIASYGQNKIEDAYEGVDSFAKISDIKYIGSYYFAHSRRASSSYLYAIYTAKVTSVNNEFEAFEIHIPVRISGLKANDEDELKSLYGNVYGTVYVGDAYHQRVSGYKTAKELYDGLIAGVSSTYTVEATSELPDLSNEVVAEPETPAEGETPAAGETPTGEDTPVEGDTQEQTEAATEETPVTE